jgi:hypothetical protein
MRRLRITMELVASLLRMDILKSTNGKATYAPFYR